MPLPICPAVLFVLLAAGAEGREPEALQRFLALPIVGDALPLSEVERYCADRVPALPPPTSAAEWETRARRLRADLLAKIVFRGQASRWRDAACRVQWLDTIPGGPGYNLQKLRYEALPGMWIPAVLYRPERLKGNVPVVMNVNGHVGAPGKAIAYKQLRCINLAKRGMLSLNVEWIGMGQLAGPGFVHACMNQLDLCGASGLAPFYLAMQRGLDLLLTLEHADPRRVAVTGLSGGGWQTIVISALDARVTLANPVAGYSSLLTRCEHLKDLGDSEQMPNDLATVADYTHLTALRAPRPTLLTYNSKDNCCFESGYALQPLVDAARPVFALFGQSDRLRTHVNDDPGTHNYELDNRQALYSMLGDFFYPGDSSFQRSEIPSEAEVKTPEDLAVELPEPNQDFTTLAADLARDLPRGPALPGDPAAAAAWRAARRGVLKELVRAQDLRAEAAVQDEQAAGELKAVLRRFTMGDAWTVPGLELTSGPPQRTAILVADAGRAKAAAEAQRLLQSGCRVLAIDPFGLGESAIPKRGTTLPLLLAAVGERPLGLQAGQIRAVARWAAREFNQPVVLASSGPRSSLMILVAAAMDEQPVGKMQLTGGLASLKELLDPQHHAGKTPEMFCFGLLEQFDIPQIKALADDTRPRR